MEGDTVNDQGDREAYECLAIATAKSNLVSSKYRSK
jgi:hypothetical protein